MSSKKSTVIIQARTGSHRLPKKVLALIEKKPMIWHVINRVKLVEGVDQIVLATTRSKEDKILLEFANKCEINYFIGSTNDVLDRYYNCALKFKADPIIRITADCPLIDPILISEMLKFYQSHNFDYVSNTLQRTFPDGLDVEIFSFSSLKKAHKMAKSEREHVTPYIRNNKAKFRLFNYKNKKNLSSYRWTVDEKSDLKFVRTIYLKLRPNMIFNFKDVLGVIKNNPEISKINRHISSKEGHQVSEK